MTTSKAMTVDSLDVIDDVDRVHQHYSAFRQQLSGVIVGLEDVTEQVMIALLCRGHCILEGMPGLAKTLMISTVASLLDLKFRRIQFTPDLMPADITGTDVLEEDRTTGKRIFRFVEGPLFGNVILADEINRTPPKTQSALLEAMQERQLTVGGQTYSLPNPFLVMATQNPKEVEGTYPLPESQLDRFMLKIRIDYPSHENEREICRRQTTDYECSTDHVLDATDLIHMQSLVKTVVVADQVCDAAIEVVRATRAGAGMLPAKMAGMVQWGAGPRASIALLMAAKARALLHRRCHATKADVLAVALPVLRHRLVLNFNAEAAGVDSDTVLSKIIEQTDSMRDVAAP